jgi:hypothetical protein
MSFTAPYGESIIQFNAKEQEVVVKWSPAWEPSERAEMVGQLMNLRGSTVVSPCCEKMVAEEGESGENPEEGEKPTFHRRC